MIHAFKPASYARKPVRQRTFFVLTQVAQLLQRDRAAGWVSYGQQWKAGTGRQYFTNII